MSDEALCCDSCKAPIPESAFERGEALSLLNKNYCARCKADVLKNVALEDVVGGPVAVAPSAPKAAPKPPPPARPRPEPARPAPAARPARPETARKPAVQRRPSAALPLVLCAAVGLGLLIVAVYIIVARGRHHGRTPPAPGGTAAAPPPAPGAPPQPPRPGDPREAKAQAAFAAVERAAASASGADEVLAAAEAARTDCRGTPFEAKLEDLRNKFQKRKDDQKAEADLRKAIDDIKAAIAGDKDYARYEEVMKKAQEARALAARVAPAAVPEIQTVISPYSGAYEKLAEPEYARISEMANGLAGERRFDDALKVIETFPAQLRQSQSWKSLESLKRQIENQKKNTPK